MQRPAQFAALFAAILLGTAGPALAQAPPGPVKPRPGVEIEQRKPPEKPQIRVRVELVNTPVTVRDARGELVLDLAQRDFRIYDNGVEQKIEHFDLGGDPLSVAILIEASSRVEPLLNAVHKTGILFAESIVGQSGEAAVITFDDTASLRLDFTADHDAIQKTIERFPVGTSGARLYDALSEAVGLLHNRPQNHRHVILAVTEAYDAGSETKLGAVLREAQLTNITIYTVGLSTTAAMLRAEPKQAGPPPITPPGTFGLPPIPGVPQTPTTEQQRRAQVDLLAAIIWLVKNAANAIGENSLEMATTGTGGLHVPTFRDRSIERALAEIGAELHAQYTLSYRPAGVDPAGYHEIRVQVARPGVGVRARPGYYLAPPEK